MTAVKLISFDMEGTLVKRKYSELIWETDIPQLYAETHGLDFETAKKEVMSAYDTVRDDEPEWYNTDYWFKRLHLKGDWTELLENRRKDCEAYPEAHEVLTHLNEKYTLVISSNTIREFLEVQLSTLPDIFDRVYSAPSDYNTVKKADKFYSVILSERNLEPSEVIHVGDSLKYDYQEANKLGIIAYYLDWNKEMDEDYVVHSLYEFMEKVTKLRNR